MNIREFTPEHLLYKSSFERFLQKEVTPHYEQWEEDGLVPRSLWLRAGAQGFLCPTIPEELGGSGADLLFSVAQFIAVADSGFTGLIGMNLHNEVVAKYILLHGTPEQRRTYLPRMATGEAIGAIAMTEPAGGSDLKAMTTVAMPARKDGVEGFRIRGSKTFITNGVNCDFALVACKTDPTAGARGISLFFVHADDPGFGRSSAFKKLGMRSQDTAQLFFDDVFVAQDRLLGGDALLHGGFGVLMQELAWERLQLGISAVVSAAAALRMTTQQVQERRMFGQSMAEMQNTRFVLAQLHAEIRVNEAYIQQCVTDLLEGRLSVDASSIAKLMGSELQWKVVDQGMQLFGGYGYMWEAPIARAWVDARPQRIYAGSNEVMKEIIARSLFSQ